jgi:hypothetical protein
VTFQLEPVDVPVAWLWAQDTASALITASGRDWPRASFELRATHDVLALTIILAGLTGSAAHPTDCDLGVLGDLLADDVAWAVWCQGRLDNPEPVLIAADADMARSAWLWLTRSKLLGGEFQDSFNGVGVSLGVTEARGVLEGRATRC